jgi:hypothetical protein
LTLSESTVAFTDDRLGQGADASSPLSVVSAAVQLCRVPVPIGGHHGGGALLPALWLSYRDIEDVLAERCIAVDHVTVYRGCNGLFHCWLRRLAPAGMRRVIGGLVDECILSL